MIFDSTLRALTIVLLVVRTIFWYLSSKHAHKAKQKTAKPTRKGSIVKTSFKIIRMFIYLQLFGVAILPITTHMIFVQILGFFLVVVGATVSVLGRVELGTNWTHGADYQIKQEHTLVTSGIYKYIRHPIYAGVIIGVTGAELVAKSYLFLPIFLLYFVNDFLQARREERLLTQYFGETFIAYKARTKLFIPFLF